MTDPTEQTALEAISARLPSWLGYSDANKPTRWNYGETALRALGIDPDMPVAQVREDLAIAARVRDYAARVEATTTPSDLKASQAGLLAYLLNGEPERPVHPRGHDHVEGQLYCNVPGCPDLEDYFP